MSLSDESNYDHSPEAPLTLGRRRALVIDDNTDLALLIQVLLSRQGFDVYQAHDGLEGLARFSEVQPDIVILDVQLPQMDGWEVLRQLQQLSAVPVVMLSASADWMARLKGRRLGAVAFVTKPFRPQELVACVQALVPN